jgi:hypothetical protein
MYTKKHFLFGQTFYLNSSNLTWAESHLDEFKLLLRDMDYFTRDEAMEAVKLDGVEWYAWCFKNGFDVAELIKDGLALDKAKTNMQL